MLIGYCRTSTLDQKYGLEAQIDVLNEQGVEKIFSEQVSFVADRPELESALDFCREGDVLVVTKLDRLARSIHDLWKIVDRLEGKKVELRILDLNLDTSTPTGRLMLSMMGALAQFEREMLLERQREGIARAKAEGKFKGRVPTARAKQSEIQKLAVTGMKPTQIAESLGVSRASVYRYLSP
jgi:DNA invertase Pin-like site-specific DNA recombinase